MAGLASHDQAWPWLPGLASHGQAGSVLASLANCDWASKASLASLRIAKGGAARSLHAFFIDVHRCVHRCIAASALRIDHQEKQSPRQYRSHQTPVAATTQPCSAMRAALYKGGTSRRPY